MFAAQMQQYSCIVHWFDVVAPLKHIKIGTADGDVLIQRGCRDRSGVSANVESQFTLGLPPGHRFNKEHSALERCMSDTANAFMREGSLDRSWKADRVKQARSVFVRLNCPDPLDVLPDYERRSIDLNRGLHSSRRCRQCKTRFNG